MDKYEFFSKLWEEFAAVIIGVLVGLPAIGIVIPQLFGMLGDVEGQQLSAAFKIFATIYFTMPLILFFIWSFFQFNNRLFRQLRPLTLAGIILLIIVFVLMLIILERGIDFRGYILGIFYGVIICLLMAYWHFFKIVQGKLIRKLDWTIARLKMLNSQNGKNENSDKKQTNDDNWVQKIAFHEQKRASVLASIKLMVFFLFITTHVTVMLLYTLTSVLLNNFHYAFLLVLLYVPVLLYYRNNPELAGLRSRSLLSRSVFYSMMVVVIASIALVFYLTESAIVPQAEKGKFSKVNNEKQNKVVAHLFDLHEFQVIKTSKENIRQLDTNFRNAGLTRDTTTENLLPFYDLERLFGAKSMAKDSLVAFQTRMYRDSLPANININISKPYYMPLWTGLKKQHFDVTGIARLLKQLEQLVDKKPPFKAAEFQAIREAYASRPSIKLIRQKIHQDSIGWIAEQTAYRELRMIKVRRLAAEMDQVAAKEEIIVKNTQRVGIAVFLSTLIIGLAFLMNFSYSDDQFHRETLNDVTPVRRCLQVLCLIVLILLVPLLKAVQTSEIDPSKPASLFLVANWNLSKTFKSDVEPKEKPVAKMPPKDADDEDPTGNGEKPCKDTRKFPQCCPDSLIVKFPAIKDTMISKLIVQWSITQQSEQNKRDSIFLNTVNKLIINQKPADFTKLENRLIQIYSVLESSNSLHQQTKSGVDTMIPKLDSIIRVLERSQYKTASSQTTKR